jgi:hypothetical protein
MDLGSIKKHESARLLLAALAAGFSKQLQRTSCLVREKDQFGAAFGWNHATLVWKKRHFDERQQC